MGYTAICGETVWELRIVMNAHELMIKTNHYLIKGGQLNEKQKSNIVNQFLAARITKEQAMRFYAGVKFPNNIDASGRIMYPLYFIPPYRDGKKSETIFYQVPKTHLFSANMYELEILRLLYILAPDNTEVITMVNETIKRLKTTCFGYEDDGVGECFYTSLVVLRFLIATVPNEKKWINSRIQVYNKHVNDKKRPWFCKWYYWLCLSEIPFSEAKKETDKYKEEILKYLSDKSCVMNSERDKLLHPVLLSMLRNILCRYEEYEYIKEREPYIDNSDGRLHFDMSKNI